VGIERNTMNPILAKLGYNAHDRVVIVHADDMGMCHASTTVLDTLFGTGVVTSASIMVPCAWARTAVAWSVAHPHADIGVHLTLTSEWAHYRWRPLAPQTAADGLVDADGYMPRSVAEVFATANRDAIGREIVAQHALATSWGLSPTHLDSHMGTMFGDGIVPHYLALGVQAGAPVFLVNQTAADLARLGFDEATQAYQLAVIAQLRTRGVPLCDHIRALDLGNAAAGLDATKQLFYDLPAGLTYFIHHPALDTPELRAICPDWQARVRDYAVMTSPELRAYVQAQGIHLIGWRDIQHAIAG
jgi:predicted glycoside hydrolase/deacetylase ChbG (UPF0249 family)